MIVRVSYTAECVWLTLTDLPTSEEEVIDISIPLTFEDWTVFVEKINLADEKMMAEQN